MKPYSFPCLISDEELRIVTTGKLGKAVGIIEGHEIYYDLPQLKAIAAWHRERLQWCDFVIRGESKTQR